MMSPYTYKTYHPLDLNAENIKRVLSECVGVTIQSTTILNPNPDLFIWFGITGKEEVFESEHSIYIYGDEISFEIKRQGNVMYEVSQQSNQNMPSTPIKLPVDKYVIIGTNTLMFGGKDEVS